MWVVAALAALAVPAAPIEERVDVRLVLLDVHVLDRAHRPVAGLEPEDFTLLVGYDPVPVETFDADCDEAGERVSKAAEPARFALVFDLFHLGVASRGEALRHARRIVESSSGEELMVAAIAGREPWVVQVFTSDRDALLSALAIVETEAGRRWPTGTGHLSDVHLIEGFARLADVVGAWSGPKAAVLFSSWIAPSAREDNAFLDAARRASDARLTWYPVYAAGLEPDGPEHEPPGGSLALARLANESGGRLTRLTNDLSEAYVRAREDGRCRYTLGFYLRPGRTEEELRGRPVTIRVSGSGREVRHAERLDISGLPARAQRALDAALAAPEVFADSGLEVAVAPAVGRVAIRMRAAEAPASVTIAISDLRGGEVRRAQARRGDGYEAEFRLPAGRYRAAAAYVPPGDVRPRAAFAEFEVPARPD